MTLKAPGHNDTFGVYNDYPRARFQTGWREFAQDNDLKVGDVCAFVLTKSIRIIFEVSIFRKNEIGNSSLLPGKYEIWLFQNLQHI